MELRQLKYFVTVAKTLNFSEAARQLFITQGTLSQQVGQLEDELGMPLFHRTSHNVTLTEAGEVMLPIAKKAIDASLECKQKITDLNKSLSGTLNIGLTASFRDLLTDTVRNFVKQYPGVKLNIVYRTAPDLFKMLLKGEMDFILTFKPSATYEQVESEELFTTRVSAVVHKSHPLADVKSLSVAELERHRLILPAKGAQTRKALEQRLDVKSSNLDVVMELNDPYIIMELLHGTRLVAVLSSLATYYDNSLVAIPIDEVPRNHAGCLHWHRGAYKKRSALKFVELIKESIPSEWK